MLYTHIYMDAAPKSGDPGGLVMACHIQVSDICASVSFRVHVRRFMAFGGLEVA